MAKNSESIDVMQHAEMLKNCGVSVEDAGTRMAESLRSIDDSKPKKNPLTVKVGIDVSDALKGLKAVQREAKNTARALREVEELSDKRMIESLTDDEIFEVLSSRGWDIDTADLNDEWGLPVQSSVTMYKNHKTN